MKKICFLLALLLVLCCFPSKVNALSGEEHKDFLAKVLFGQNDFNHFKKNKHFIRLYEASQLTLDQYNGFYEKELNNLKEYGVRHLPSSIDKIDFSDNSDHRSKTHLGWDHKYPTTGKDKEANWPVRKTILLSTVNKVFNFGLFSGWFGIYDEKCNSFSALIYYVHVLGDTIADKNNKTEGHSVKKLDDCTLPLVVRQQSSVNPDIISELQKHIDILFVDQDHSGIDKELKRLRDDAYYNVYIVNKEYSDVYYGFAEELNKILIQEIPKLLKNEPFFTKVFY